MQHVITVAWSLDDKYIISGSDEMNLRMWKANASEKLGAVCCLTKHSFLPQSAQQTGPDYKRFD